MSVADRNPLRELRLRHDLTQAELARRAHLDRKTVQRIERGYRPHHGHALEHIATALGVRVDDLKGPR